ncbi:hypothetical protein SISNIDRAFT_459493 [Sistotremastrum niveocremeum HHB9708]|uniref:F-box domain-containing protein n=1 Tax=Sistotremastrum niveocremeum HHB9708 TaxID=1314777 RepID=A0A164PET9_9AGAM|nr:hypothetical protein SISNIDRAFT_459493 [Sistotremastrum niveocremeum HHB9708]
MPIEQLSHDLLYLIIYGYILKDFHRSVAVTQKETPRWRCMYSSQDIRSLRLVSSYFNAHVVNDPRYWVQITMRGKGTIHLAHLALTRSKQCPLNITLLTKFMRRSPNVDYTEDWHSHAEGFKVIAQGLSRCTHLYLSLARGLETEATNIPPNPYSAPVLRVLTLIEESAFAERSFHDDRRNRTPDPPEPATRLFHPILNLLHETGLPALTDLYIVNLDIYRADSHAASCIPFESLRTLNFTFNRFNWAFRYIPDTFFGMVLTRCTQIDSLYIDFAASLETIPYRDIYEFGRTCRTLSLKLVQFSGAWNRPLELSNTTHLTISGTLGFAHPPVAQRIVLDFLQGCPRLEFLDFAIRDARDDWAPVIVRRGAFEHLTQLVLEMNQSFTYILLASFSFPALHLLAIEPLGRFPNEHVVDYFTLHVVEKIDQFNALTTFGTRKGKDVFDLSVSLWSLVRKMPELQTLNLFGYFISGEIFTTFGIRQDSTNEFLCPKLETIIMLSEFTEEMELSEQAGWVHNIRKDPLIRIPARQTTPIIRTGLKDTGGWFRMWLSGHDLYTKLIGTQA